MYEVLVGQKKITEKTFGKTLHGFTTTIHEERPGWEHQIDNDLRGVERNFTVDDRNLADHFDIAELILGHRLLEVSRAKDYFEERLLCDDGDFLIVLGANRQSGTFTDKTWGWNVVMDEDATNNITVKAKAGHDIDEDADAGHDITEKVHAGNNITGTTTAGSVINETTKAGDALVEVSAAGRTITEVSASPTKFEFEFNLTKLELAVHALIGLEVTAALISIDAHFGTDKIEFHNGHRVDTGNAGTQLMAMITSCAAAYNELYGVHNQVAGVDHQVAAVHNIM